MMMKKKKKKRQPVRMIDHFRGCGMRRRSIWSRCNLAAFERGELDEL